MDNFTDGSLQIQIQPAGDGTNMLWLGKSEARDPSAVLMPYLNGFVENAKSELADKKLVVDFSGLEYMNSSTVPPIIHFIKNLDTNAIKTEISYDKNSKWQAASFKALETISMAMKHIKVEAH